MKAILVSPQKTPFLTTTHPLPTLKNKPEYILVRTIAIALNPTDWKSIAGSGGPGHLVGCDYAGIVEEVGSSVRKPIHKGDRVCGFVHGCKSNDPDSGTFAEFILAKGDLQIVLPENVSFQEGATLGVGITTVGQGLYQSLGLELPTPSSTSTSTVASTAASTGASEGSDGDKTLLIYGGSTATGTLAIQFAKLSGYKVITTCSPRNFELVRGLGADAVFDYNDPGAAAAIREYTGDKLRLVFDTISLEQSIKFCEEAISSAGGEYSSLLQVDSSRGDVNSRLTRAYTSLGEEFSFGTTVVPANKEDQEFAEKFWELARELLAQGKLKAHPISLGSGGLQGVLEGLERMKEGKVSGKKLVYNIADTP